MCNATSFLAGKISTTSWAQSWDCKISRPVLNLLSYQGSFEWAGGMTSDIFSRKNVFSCSVTTNLLLLMFLFQMRSGRQTLILFMSCSEQCIRRTSSQLWTDTRNCKFTVNPLYNDIRYNSKIRYYVNLVRTKISGLCIFSLLFPYYSSGKHTFCIFVRIALARRF